MRDSWDRMTIAEQSARDRCLSGVLALIPDRVRPDHLTVLRLLLVAIAVFLHFLGASLVVQVWLLLFAAVTDLVDGPLARSRDQVSVQGANLDRVADWCLGGWLGILCWLYRVISVTLAGLMIAPQLIISAFNVRTAAGDSAPTVLSRVQFVAVISGFGLLLLGRGLEQPLLQVIGTGVLYLSVLIAFVIAGRVMLVWRHHRLRHRGYHIGQG